MMNWPKRVATLALLVVPAAAAAQRGGSPPFPCALALPLSSLARPFAVVSVNSVCLDLTSFVRATTPGKVWSLLADVTVGGAAVHVVGTFNADPFVTFDAMTTNPSPGAVSYAFAFGTPVAPELYDAASSTGEVRVRTGAAGHASVAPVGAGNTYIKGYGANGPDVTNLGVDLGTAPCHADGVPLLVTQACPQGTAASTFAPTPFDGLIAVLTYEQTDLASTAQWSGNVTLTAGAPTSAVPEPVTLLLVASGLALSGVAARWRRSG